MNETAPHDALDVDLLTHAQADADAALGALIDAVRALPADPDPVAAPSALPGWTRGHVLAHVANVAAALARQAEYAAAGRRVEPYDGGRAGRDAAIEAAATRSVAEHTTALEAARHRAAAAWPPAGDALWSAPVAYRDGTVADALLAWWREARIHAVDAVVGLGVDTWDDALCAHLADFLAVRLPDDGAGLELGGVPRAVAAWLAGRTAGDGVSARRGGSPVPLPDLAPWPSAAR